MTCSLHDPTAIHWVRNSNSQHQPQTVPWKQLWRVFLHHSSSNLPCFGMFNMSSLWCTSTRCSLPLLILFIIALLPVVVRGEAGVFRVQRKFKGSDHPSFADYKKHNEIRHARHFPRKLKGIDVPLGGNVQPLGYFSCWSSRSLVLYRSVACMHALYLSSVDRVLIRWRLYFTEIEIGTPPKNYTLQVDTGSDYLWVNCAPCIGCPSNSSLKVCFL